MQTYSEITFKCIILKLNIVLLKYDIYVGFMSFLCKIYLSPSLFFFVPIFQKIMRSPLFLSKQDQ